MEDCESCRERADMVLLPACCALAGFAELTDAFFERCSDGGRTCAMYSNSAYSEKASEQDLLASLGFPSLIINAG